MKTNRAPGIAKFELPGSIEPVVASLANSLPVYLIKSGSQPVVKIDMLLRAGSWWQEKPLIASSVSAMLAEGTVNKSGKKIAGLMDYYGSYLHSWSDRDNAFISLYCLTRHLDRMLPLVAEVVREPSFPEDELDNYLRRRKQAYLTERTRVSNIARERFARVIFGNTHPYGRQVSVRDFDNIIRDDLTSFHKLNYNGANCKIIAAGSFEDDRVITLMNKLLGDKQWLPGNRNISGQKGFRKRRGTVQKSFIRRKSAVQSAIRIGRELFNKNDPDFPGMMVLNSILGGHFGSRLMQNIREKRGYTYGIGSVLVPLRYSGFISIISEVGNGYGKAALGEIYREMEKLRDKRVPLSELERTKRQMLGELLRGFDGPFARAESFRSLLEYDMDNDYFHRLAETIRDINPERIQELAARYLSPASMHEVVAGDKNQ